MTISTIALVAVYRRVFCSAPLLFHDVRTPSRQERRKARIRRWMGPIGLAVAGEYERRNGRLTDRRPLWRRSGWHQ